MTCDPLAMFFCLPVSSQRVLAQLTLLMTAHECSFVMKEAVAQRRGGVQPRRGMGGHLCTRVHLEGTSCRHLTASSNSLLCSFLDASEAPDSCWLEIKSSESSSDLWPLRSTSRTASAVANEFPNAIRSALSDVASTHCSIDQVHDRDKGL